MQEKSFRVVFFIIELCCRRRTSFSTAMPANSWPVDPQPANPWTLRHPDQAHTGQARCLHSRMAECRRRGLTGFRLDGCSVRRVANGKANGNGQLPHKHCWGSYPSEFRGEMGDGLRPILEARRRCLSANAKQRGAHAVVFRDDASGATLPAPTRWRGPPDNGLYHIKLELGPARTRRHAVAGLGPASLSFTKCCCVTRRSQDKYSVSTQHRRPCSPPSRRKTAAPGALATSPKPCWTLDALGLQEARRMSSGQLRVAHAILGCSPG